MKRKEFFEKTAIVGGAIVVAPLLSAVNKDGINLSLERDKLIKIYPDFDRRLYPKHIEAYELGMMAQQVDNKEVVNGGKDCITYHFLSEIVIGKCNSMKDKDTVIMRRSVDLYSPLAADLLKDIDKERHAFFNDCVEKYKEYAYNI